jgi:hypothetical protein
VGTVDTSRAPVGQDVWREVRRWCRHMINMAAPISVHDGVCMRAREEETGRRGGAAALRDSSSVAVWWWWW